MDFYHVMIRVKELEESIKFWTELMNFEVVKHTNYDEGRYTLVFLRQKGSDFMLEFTFNWDQEGDYSTGRNFGHLAFYVDDIYETCEKFLEHGITINRPPRDGYMAFVKDPNNISIELLQKKNGLPPKEPWASMPNTGSW